MFNAASSSSDEKMHRTRTITVAYAEAPCSEDVSQAASDDYVLPYVSTTSLRTPSMVSGLTLLDQLERDSEVEKYFGYSPVWRDMSMSEGNQLKTLGYMWKNNIFQLFSFLMTHLLSHTPEDPVPFLVELLDRCIRFRDEEGDPPLVFEDKHVENVYVSLDHLAQGTISYSQYLAGMNTLGLTQFNIIPDDMDKTIHSLSKDMFIKEAKSALINQLGITLGKTQSPVKSVDVDNVVDNTKLRPHTKSKLKK